MCAFSFISIIFPTHVLLCCPDCTLVNTKGKDGNHLLSNVRFFWEFNLAQSALITNRSHSVRFHALDAIEKKSQNPNNIENGKDHNPWVSTWLAGAAELLECFCQLLEPVDLLVRRLLNGSSLPVDLLVGRLQQVEEGQAQGCQGHHQNSQNLHTKQV